MYEWIPTMYNLTNKFQHSEPLYFVPIYRASSESHASLEKEKNEKEKEKERLLQNGV